MSLSHQTLHSLHLAILSRCSFFLQIPLFMTKSRELKREKLGRFASSLKRLILLILILTKAIYFDFRKGRALIQIRLQSFRLSDIRKRDINFVFPSGVILQDNPLLDYRFLPLRFLFHFISRKLLLTLGPLYLFELRVRFIP